MMNLLTESSGAAGGGIALMLPLCTDREILAYFLKSCDGFLLTGGQDVSPSLYGAEKMPQCGEVCKARDDMDGYILHKAILRDKPVLGICRGIQLMNALLGGTLYQDLSTQRPSPTEHHMQPPYDREAHRVMLQQGTPLFELLQRRECPVNSYPHQGIRSLAPGLSIMATAQEGLIEGVYLPQKRFIWGIQWHPEFSFLKSAESRMILGALVQAAKD